MLDVTERLGRVLGKITIPRNTIGGSTGAQTFSITGLPAGNRLWAYVISSVARDMATYPNAGNSYTGLGACPLDIDAPAVNDINYRGGYGGWLIIYGCF